MSKEVIDENVPEFLKLLLFSHAYTPLLTWFCHATVVAVAMVSRRNEKKQGVQEVTETVLINLGEN